MSIVQTRPQQLEEGLITFATDTVLFARSLPSNPENKILTTQLIRAASSIGANYTEANNASSRIDFRNKIFIAKKEAAETRYWLRSIEKTNREVEASQLVDEVSQVLFILQKIVSTLKNGK